MGMKKLGGIGVAWFVATVVAVTIAAAAVGSVRSEVTDVPTALGVSAAPIFASATQEEPSEFLDDVSAPERGASSTLAPDVETEPPAPPVVETTSIDRPGTETTTTTASTTTTGQIVYEEDGTRHEEAAKSLPQAGSTPSTSSVPQPTTSTTTTTIGSTTTTSSTTTVPTTPTTTSTTTTTMPAPTPYTRAIDTDGGSLSVRVNGNTVVFRRAFPNNGWRFDLTSGGPEVVEARFTKTDDRSTRIRVLVTVTDGTLEISITPSK